MSKGKRSRRPGGHPAKVAVRRERDAARRAPAPPRPDSVARRIVHEASELKSPLDAELWASRLLGVFWDQRYTLPLEEAASPDYSLILGEPLIEAVAKLGGEEARTALSIISSVDDGELGMRAGELAEQHHADSGDAAPSWLGEVGEAEITAAAVMREDVFDDACTVFLEARHPSGETHAVGVLIDNNLGVMAKGHPARRLDRSRGRGDAQASAARRRADARADRAGGRGGADRRSNRAHRDDAGSAGGG